MNIIRIGGGILDSESLNASVHALRNGEIICYPTETYYALGIDFKNEKAISKLYELKQRPSEKELPLIASSIPMVASICYTGDARFGPLAAKFWPGPLTLVLPSLDGSTSFAIRVSSHPVAAQLADALGSPLVSTSANQTGEPPVRDPSALSGAIRSELGLILDAGPSAGEAPSTIASLLERPGKILREGAIPADQVVSLL